MTNSKPAAVTAINQKARDDNWRGLVGDILSEDNVKGVAFSVFYNDSTYRISWSGDIRSSDLALASVRLARLADE